VAEERFRLLPRRAWAVWTLVVFGTMLAALPLLYGVRGAPRVVDLIAGLGAVAMAATYLSSPTWRSHVVATDAELAVVGPAGDRLRVAWSEIVEVIADAEENAALVRGPSPGQSLLIPSNAHPAPYRIAGSAALYARVLARVPKEKVRFAKDFK
jgi:hypothetical protein